MGPPGRQIDDADVKPSTTSRTLSVCFPSEQVALRAQSRLADVADARLYTHPVATLVLTVDSPGMRRVRDVVEDLGGQVVQIH